MNASIARCFVIVVIYHHAGAVGQAPSGVTLVLGFSHSGVLGIIHCKKESPSEFEEDHALIAVRQLDTFLEKCCTPLGRIRGRRGVQPLACDYDLLAHIKKTVLCVAADGGAKERRAVFLAVREISSNRLLVLRGPAHALRLATQSLHSDDVFGQVWHDLFDSRHALVPDLVAPTNGITFLWPFKRITSGLLLNRECPRLWMKLFGTLLSPNRGSTLRWGLWERSL